jgi:hypothetical protein
MKADGTPFTPPPEAEGFAERHRRQNARFDFASRPKIARHDFRKRSRDTALRMTTELNILNTRMDSSVTAGRTWARTARPTVTSE